MYICICMITKYYIDKYTDEFKDLKFNDNCGWLRTSLFWSICNDCIWNIFFLCWNYTSFFFWNDLHVYLTYGCCLYKLLNHWINNKSQTDTLSSICYQFSDLISSICQNKILNIICNTPYTTRGNNFLSAEMEINFQFIWVCVVLFMIWLCLVLFFNSLYSFGIIKNKYDCLRDNSQQETNCHIN